MAAAGGGKLPALMTLRERIIADLAAAGLSPLHRLGQNFMVDAGAIAAMVEALELKSGSRVVEIGPGTGVLTEPMLERGAQVLAVELDRGLAKLLQERLVPRGLQLVHGDALAGKNRLNEAIERFARGPWKLGANLPYDVAIPALLNAAALTSPALQPERAVVTVQFEAAQRLCSRPGADAWGASAAVLQAAGSAEILRKLSPQSFYPRPRVDSALLVWRPRHALPAGFGQWCRRVFAFRRKVLTRALRDAGMDRDAAEAACAACGLAVTRRLEDLDSPELVALHAVAQHSSAAGKPNDEFL